MLTQAARATRRVLRENQEENSKHEAEEDAKENPFAVCLAFTAWFGTISGNGFLGQRGEPEACGESQTP